MLALLVANFGTTTAEFSGVAAAFSLAHVPAWLAVPPVAVGVWLLVTRGTLPHGGARLPRPDRGLRRPTSSPASSPSPDWGAAVHGTVVPQVQTSSLWLLTAIAAIGTTITPWGQFFIQAYIVDKRISIARYAYTKVEVYMGAVFTDAIDLFIVLACAATLYKEGIVVETAQDAARALAPLAGQAADAPLRLRAAQRLDPGRRDPAADHGLRRLRGVRLRERAGQERSTRRRPSTAC